MNNLINKIINADCIDILKKLPDKSVDLVLTDPPYRNSKDNAPTKDMRTNGYINLGNKPTEEMFEEIFRVSKNQIIFGANNFNLPPCKGFIVWDKKLPFKFTMSMAEIAWMSENLGTISKIYRIAAFAQKNRIHPTQKPLQLFEMILNDYSKEGDLVLDCFSGSGTTAIACYNLNRRFICVEKEYCYWADSIKRLNNSQKQMQLFGGGI